MLCKADGLAPVWRKTQESPAGRLDSGLTKISAPAGVPQGMIPEDAGGGSAVGDRRDGGEGV